jgi:hypothetical protein
MEFDEACAFIRLHHRHHKPPQGHKFSVGVANSVIVGVAIVGRPTARPFQDGWTLEITRLATDGTRNACSSLYRACTRAAFAMGYRRVVTYTRTDEGGASLRGAGFTCVAVRPARSWDAPSRPRVDKSEPHERLLWELVA